jgi:hypothetical protein
MAYLKYYHSTAQRKDLVIWQASAIFFLTYSVRGLHSQPPVLPGPARVWSCIVWIRSEVWRHVARVVRHRMAGGSRDVGVEVGARVGPVGRRRGEDAGCNENKERWRDDDVSGERYEEESEVKGRWWLGRRIRRKRRVGRKTIRCCEEK